MTTVKIADRLVGDGQPCFIVAEAGVNHNGEVRLAKKLIDASREAGADAIKFQSFHASEIVTPGAEKAGYQKETTGGDNQLSMLQKLELSPENFRELSRYCRDRNIIFLSTGFDIESVDLLDELAVPAFKIPSGEITNFPLIKHIAGKKKPVILSTGMANVGEIDEALTVLREKSCRDIILLHCVSCYPARVEDSNIRFIETMRDAFGLPTGLSDHTSGTAIPLAAVALGACVIEKHFTIDKRLPGPDHRASLEPQELKEMISGIRDVEKALGDGIKRITAEEEANKKVVRRSLVARIEIPAGATITEDMIAIKRPGTGLEPKYIHLVRGKKARRKLSPGELITLAEVA